MALDNTGVGRFVLQNCYTKTQLNAGQLDNLYFGEDEFIATSAGAGDAGKPVKLNGSGVIDSSMLSGGSLATHAALTAAHGASGAVVGTTNLQTLTNKTLTSPDMTSPTVSSGNLTLSTGKVIVSENEIQLTKTAGCDIRLGAGSFSGTATVAGFGTVGAHNIEFRTNSLSRMVIDGSTGAVTIGGVAVVTTTGTQTLTNKTLTSPVISTISNTGTLTLPTSTDTLVGRATTDTLTNKTLTSPTINTPTIGTSAIIPIVYGSSSADGDITIEGTSSATKTTSYVRVQPTGGGVVIGGTTAEYELEIHNQGASNHRLTFNVNDSGEQVIASINDPVGAYTQAPLRLYGSRIRFNGIPNIMTSSTPASASAAGTAGDIAWDTSYLYIATGTNQWRRIAHSTW